MSEHVLGDGIPLLSGYSEAELDSAFAAISREVESSAAALASPEAVEAFRLHWLGRKQGRLKAISDAWLKSAPAEAKKLIGQRFNTLKATIEERLETAGKASGTSALDAEAIDIPPPGPRRRLGAEHPLIKTLNELVSIFAR